MSPRILIHAGFHKTGTTTVQATLRTNRALLNPQSVLALPWRMRPLLYAARAYSTYADPLSLAKFAHRAAAFVADLPPLKHRGLIACSEELSGHLPGRGGLPDYRFAPVLMGELALALRQRYPDHDTVFVFSTRHPDAWLDSAYWEQVKSSSQSMDLSEYRETYRSAADFGPILDRVRAAIAPARLETFALEDCTSPLGPAEPLLRLAGIDPAALSPVAPANTRLPQEVLERFLRINRTFPDSASRQAAKDAVLQSLPGTAP